MHKEISDKIHEVCYMHIHRCKHTYINEHYIEYYFEKKLRKQLKIYYFCCYSDDNNNKFNK